LKLKIDFEIAKNELDQQWPGFFMMGSCFAQSQAIRMKSLGFDIASNPFGIIYNPQSIATLLQRIVTKGDYSETDFEHRTSFFSWEHHGDYKYQNLEDAAVKSNQILAESHSFLAQANVVVITLGTSIVHTFNNKTVANCHKIPNKEFEQRQLSYAETLDSLIVITKLVKELNPKAHLLFTLSPIRHLRSGVIENSRSKATLLSAVHEVVNQNNNCSYFPSYEIFMDELRDYRFAKEDMTHPTPQAEQYIWERFCETYFPKETRKTIEEVTQFHLFATHKPSNTELHTTQLADKKEKLLNKYPFLQL
jgi:hypothetical protein